MHFKEFQIVMQGKEPLRILVPEPVLGSNLHMYMQGLPYRNTFQTELPMKYHAYFG